MQRKNKKHIWQYAIRKDVNYFENVIPMIVYFHPIHPTDHYHCMTSKIQTRR